MENRYGVYEDLSSHLHMLVVAIEQRDAEHEELEALRQEMRALRQGETLRPEFDALRTARWLLRKSWGLRQSFVFPTAGNYVFYEAVN